MDLLTDRVTAGLVRALDGIAAQQRQTADNIANVQTPGYRAKRVNFADSLASALQDGGDPSQASITTVDAGTPANIVGNTVQIDAEVADQQREVLAYQAVAQAISYKFAVWRTAIGS